MASSLEELLKSGTRLLHQGKTEAAITTLAKAYDLDNNHFDVSLNLAGAYILGGKFTRAIPLLEDLVNSGRGDEAVWTNLGAAYLGNPVLAKEADHVEALKAFKAALEINPKAPNAAYNIALIHRDRKEYDLAAEWFRKAIRISPGDRDARNHLSKIQSLLTEPGADNSDTLNEGSEFIK